MKKYLLQALYQFLITLSLPFAIIRLYWKSRQNPDYRKRLSERFAINLPTENDGTIWVHCVSVGEFLATLPLIERLLTHKHPLLITTTTPTASKIVTEKLGMRVAHCYLPFDQYFLAKRFLKKINPSIAVFVETEIWANYLLALKKQKIPTLLINARLSEKSFNGYAKLGSFAQQILACFTEVACQNKPSQQRFQQLGANASMLGNIKFDLSAPANLAEKQKQLRQLLGDKPFILASSTHKGEDEILLAAFQRSPYAKTHRLIIAPRHPERSNDVVKLCKEQKVTVILYTAMTEKKAPYPADTQVILINTLGELLYFYALADFAIIGGSLIAHGGHNPLEAALFSTPCLIGKNYFNFESLVNEMAEQNAIIITGSEKLFVPRTDLAQVGKNAQQFLLNNQGAIARYEKLIIENI